jgi:molybdopterin converting factor subunit 1
MVARFAVKITVLYFGIVRERLGLGEEILELNEGCTVDELLAELSARDENIAAGAGSVRVAVNREYVDGSAILHDLDEAAVIPPVSGGL